MRPKIEYNGVLDFFKNHCVREGVSASNVAHYARVHEIDKLTALEIVSHKAKNKPPKVFDMSQAIPGLKYRTIVVRLHRGWTLEQALNTPTQKPKPMDMTGAGDGVSARLYSLRIHRGWSHETAMQKPASKSRAK